MTNQTEQHVEDLTTLSTHEMEEVQGGDIVPTDPFSLNFAKIEFESAQSSAASDVEWKYIPVRR